jgi:hypothetical protein
MVRSELSPDDRRTLEEIRDRLTSAYDRVGKILGDAPATPAAFDTLGYYRARRAAAPPAGRQARSDDERLELETARAEIGRARTDVRRVLGETGPAPENRRRPIVSRPHQSRHHVSQGGSTHQ